MKQTSYPALDWQGRRLGAKPIRCGPPCPDCATVMEPSHVQSPVAGAAWRVEAGAPSRSPATTWQCPTCGIQTPREQGC